MRGFALATALVLLLRLAVASRSIPTPSLRDHYYRKPVDEEELEERRRQVETLTSFLFPNRTAAAYPLGLDHGRELIVTSPLPGANVVCVTCTGMKYCPALNQYRIEEVYLPNNLEAKGTCVVLDDLGMRVQADVFGEGRTFRDTAQCRDIVMQYLCLFYGSNNNMYRNWCQFREDVTPASKAEYKIAPRYPCRSFCVQVATVCANDPLFLQLCGQIKCPPKQDECTPNPTILDAQGKPQDLAANLGCDMPFKLDPYSPKNAGARSGGRAGLNLAATAFALSASAAAAVLFA